MKVKVSPRVSTVGSHRGGVIRIDQKLPHRYHQSCAYHELIEHQQMKEGLSYAQAHRIANEAERQRFFKGKPRQWKEYQKTVNKIYRRNQRR